MHLSNFNENMKMKIKEEKKNYANNVPKTVMIVFHIFHLIKFLFMPDHVHVNNVHQ